MYVPCHSPDRWRVRGLGTSQDGPRASRDVLRTWTTVRWVNQASWAKETAQRLLADHLPQRWAHTQGVAARSRFLAPILGEHAELLEASAWLHDIGYAPDLGIAGFHPLDGARHLRDVEQADPLLCQLVAHHSCAAVEAEARGLRNVLESEFDYPPAGLSDALTFCDMTTSPSGAPTSVQDRLAEINTRYATGDIVARSMARAEPLLLAATERVATKLARSAC